MKRSLRNWLSTISQSQLKGPAQGPTPWVNSIVVVPKSGGDICLCIDMCRANQAILRERHPIPIVDKIMQSLFGREVFSRLDLQWGYHQLEMTALAENLG